MQAHMERLQIGKPVFRIIVRVNQPKTEILGFDAARQAYRMNVHAKPEHNKANIEVISFLRKHLKKDVKIISGLTSKEKIIRIDQKF
ncbi:MAG TPA: DUF167 domain-containing protein [Candidatus Nanoarchaeia archaeon]|nr:DUF167 domain-containing protein [Candidatus Nanoarchaeia archaeon]